MPKTIANRRADKSDWYPYLVRVPPKLIDDLRKQVHEEEQGMNTIVVNILTKGLEQEIMV